MNKLFVLILAGLCSQGFCMDRSITADEIDAQESSSSANIAEIAGLNDDMEVQFDALRKLVSRQGETLVDLVGKVTDLVVIYNKYDYFVEITQEVRKINDAIQELLDCEDMFLSNK